jgi:acetyl esterase/lipase
VAAEDILEKPQPAADGQVAYGNDPNQFLQFRLPHGQRPYPALLNIHGGFWRAKYDLTHAGHLCEAFRQSGIATFNTEYRRVGNVGGGWPGTFEDIRSAYHFVRQAHARFDVDPNRFLVMGHSAGGQLALCLASHEASVRRGISLAGVVDLRRALSLHLSHDAVSEFLGGPPELVPEHYREADPMELSIPQARQWLICGSEDETVPPEFSRDYVKFKGAPKSAPAAKKELVELVEIPKAGHFDLLDPSSAAFQRVTSTVLAALA